jgi:DNA repair exonuclease SbcCD nuclease subunit
MNKVLAILTADIHLRDDVPKCRLDNFMEAQKNKLLWLDALQKEHQCPILDGGDLFHKWKVSPYLINFALKYLPNNFFTVMGNHDLPQHNIELLDQSGLGVLLEAGKINILTGVTKFNNFTTYAFGWNKDISNIEYDETTTNIALAHVMTYRGEKPYPQCTDLSVNNLLTKYDGYDLILTGHNHKCFVCESEDNRWLVNAGSLTRQNADQLNYKPAVHLFMVDENRNYKVQSVSVPIEADIIDRSHLESKKEIDSRMEAFVTTIGGNWDVGISFEHNMEECIKTENIEPEVEAIILKEMGK